MDTAACLQLRTLPWWRETSHRQYLTNGHGCVPIQICLWTLKSEFHVTQNITIILVFQPFKSVNTIFSLQTIHKVAAGWIWPAGHSLPTHGLRITERACTRETKHKYTGKNTSNDTVQEDLKYQASQGYGCI